MIFQWIILGDAAFQLADFEQVVDIGNRYHTYAYA
jgi:hypothetical protein